MKIKTSELTGRALDWAVAKCEFGGADEWSDDYDFNLDVVTDMSAFDGGFNPSTNWAIAGPIIEQERIGTEPHPGSELWVAFLKGKHVIGPTPLIAAMRCYVTSRLGDTVDIPKELCQ